MRIWIVWAAAIFCGSMHGTCEEPPSLIAEAVNGRWELQTYTLDAAKGTYPGLAVYKRLGEAK